jgi:hypothetical protein
MIMVSPELPEIGGQTDGNIQRIPEYVPGIVGRRKELTGSVPGRKYEQ